MKKISIICALTGVYLLTLRGTMPTSAMMASPSYRVPAQVLDGGGSSGSSSSAQFRLIGAIGQASPIGSSQAAGFHQKAGFIPQITGKGCPTLIELDQLSAVSQKDSIVISWRTLSEIDTVGFYLWRSESKDSGSKDNDGEYIRVNPGIIGAEGGATLGAEYVYRDDTAEAGVRYYYKLEEIDTKGTSTFHGPVPVLIKDTRTARE